MSFNGSKLAVTPTTQALLIFVVCAGTIHFGGNVLKRDLLAAPTMQVLQRDPPAQALAIKPGAINVIEEHRIDPAKSAAISDLPSDLPNQLFNASKSSPGGPDKQDTDYFAQLHDHVHLDAITHNGVVINGKYVKIGEPLYERAYPAPGADPTDVDNFIAARVISASGNVAVVREPLPPHRTIRLTLD